MHIVSKCQSPTTGLQLVQHRGEDPDTGGSDGVTKRDSRAIDVETVVNVGELDAPAGQDREHLNGERLVDLDQGEIVETESAFC